MPQNPLPIIANSPLGGAAFNDTISNRSFYVTTAAGVTLVASGQTTYTGLAISNPATSGVVLAIQKLHAVNNVIAAAVFTPGFATGKGALSAPGDSLVVASNYIGGSVAGSATLVSATCTLPSTYPLWAPMAAPQIAAGGYVSHLDVNGGLVIPPGYFGAFVVVGTATTSGALLSINWTELV